MTTNESRDYDINRIAAIATVVGAVVATLQLLVGQFIHGLLLQIAAASMLVVAVALLVALFFVRRYFGKNIESLFVNVRFVSCRTIGDSRGPVERGRKFPEVGKDVSLDVYDHAVSTFDWIPNRYARKPLTVEHQTSGLMILEPVSPSTINYNKKLYKSKAGQHNAVLADIPVVGSQLIRYATSRFNGFQAEDQDFMAPPSGKLALDFISLCIDFQNVLPGLAFSQLPEAHLIEYQSGKQLGRLPVSSSSGRRWTAEERKLACGQAVKISWKLVEGFPPKPLYVFGYGSLMHASSVRESIDYNDQEMQLVPAYLNCFKRDFSAVVPNINGFTTTQGEEPDNITYMNVLPCHQDSRALGVLLRVHDEQLCKLDEREWMYVRMDVTDHIEFPSRVDFQLEEDARVFTFVCIQPKKWEEYDGRTAFGADYERLINNAHMRIDSELGDEEFSVDFQRVLNQYRHWPRVERSNTRKTEGYE